MNSYPFLHPISTVSHTFPTSYYFADLDVWVDEARGTPEYQTRLELADQIVQSHRVQSTGFLVEGGNLTSLPKAIGFLSFLEELTITKNSLLTSLPAEIGELKSLKRLVLSDLGLTSLPREIGRCSDLQDLHIEKTELTLIPDEIGDLHRLEFFYLGGNSQLSYLPSSIGRLQNLLEISLRDCNFSYLPKELFSLPKLTYLDLLGCPFSPHALERLQTFAQPPRTIVYSQENLQTCSMTERPLEELLERLCHLSGKRRAPFFRNLSKHPDLEILQKFLNKFFHAVNFREGDFRHAAIASKLIDYLVEAEKNRYYRKSFFACLKNASSLEKDQISILFFLLGMEKKLAGVNFTHLKILYKNLVGVWTTRLILRIVRERLNDLAVYDSASVYLGYLSKLIEWHDLPLDVEDFSLFDINEIPAVQLHTASQQVDRAEANLTMQAEFLASHDLWLEALKHANPLIYQEKRGDREAFIKWTRDVIAGFSSNRC